jgi:hypothetical protein
MLLVGGACLCGYADDAGAGARPATVFGRSARLSLQGADGVAFDRAAAAATLYVADFAADTVHLIRTSTPVSRALRIADVTAIRGPATGLDGPIGLCVGP